MTLEQLIAEMQRNPYDAESTLIDWIREQAMERATIDDLASDIVEAIDACSEAQS